MVCDSWKTKLDTYLDRELPDEEMRAFDAHMRGCASCSADALARVQLKRAIRVAGKRFAPSAEFRRRMQEKIAPKPQRNFRLLWVLAASALAIVVAGALTANYVRGRSARDHVFSEIADLHVATLASSSPVDVVSTDRHTVKPWFQGKIPFAFDLPELQNSGFTLLGGRMTYLGQTPGAHLIYELRKHRISVFVFPEGALPGLGSGENKDLSFSMETWSQGGLRYFVIGDANAGDIDSLAKLFKGGV
jgi:anti-sigma factor RsiW